MKYLNQSKSKFLCKLTGIGNVRDFFEYISVYIERLSFVLLVIWVVTPIVILIKSICSVTEPYHEYFIRDVLSIQWNTILQQVGFAGFILFILLTSNYLIGFDRKVHGKNLDIETVLWLLILLLIWSVFSTLSSDNRTLSLYGTTYRKDGLLSYIAYTGIFTCGYSIRDIRKLVIVLFVNILVATILAILMLLNIDTLNDILTLYPNSAVFFNINHFGYYLSLAVMCSIILVIISSSKQHKNYIFGMIGNIILTTALIKNKSFGPYLAVIGGMLMLVVMNKYISKNGKMRLYIIIAIFMIISFVYNVSDNRISNEIEILKLGIESIINNEENANQAGSGRWMLWSSGIKFISEKPIFGYGPDNLGDRYLSEGLVNDRPHNEIIQIAASLGIPAAIFYISAIIIYYWNFFKYRKYFSVPTIGLFSTTFTYFISSLFGNSMFYTSPFYFMIFGMSVSRMQNTILKSTIR